jgi:hypothetical protein
MPRARSVSLPKALLHLEGLVVLVLAFIFYLRAGNPWWLFLLLVLVPDVSMAGYVRRNRIGATIYNLGHTYVFPAVLGLFGVLASNRVALAAALIWAAHVGMDRALGYGLKYATGFKETHLGRV